MSDQIMTAAVQMDGIIPEVWAAAFYPTLLEALPFNDVVSRDYEGEIAALGDTVNINTFPQFGVAEDFAEDQKVDAEAITVSKQQLVINHQLGKDFIITEKALKQSIDAQNVLRDLAFHSLMKKLQLILVADTVPSPSAPDHTIAYTSGTTLALADILNAKELLDTANVPDVGRVMIVGPAQWNDIFNIAGFTSRDFIPAGSPLTSGSLPTPILGFQPKMTTEVGNVAYLFHPMYMSLAVQQSPQVKVYDLGVQGVRAQRVNVDVLLGDKQLSNVRVVTIS